MTKIWGPVLMFWYPSLLRLSFRVQRRRPRFLRIPWKGRERRMCASVYPEWGQRWSQEMGLCMMEWNGHFPHVALVVPIGGVNFETQIHLVHLQRWGDLAQSFTHLSNFQKIRMDYYVLGTGMQQWKSRHSSCPQKAYGLEGDVSIKWIVF